MLSIKHDQVHISLNVHIKRESAESVTMDRRSVTQSNQSEHNHEEKLQVKNAIYIISKKIWSVLFSAAKPFNINDIVRWFI